MALTEAGGVGEGLHQPTPGVPLHMPFNTVSKLSTHSSHRLSPAEHVL